MSSSAVFQTLRNYMSASQSKCYFPHPWIVQRRRLVNQHFTFSENKWTTALSYWNSLCSFHRYLQLFVGWFMPYLRHLCLFAHSGVQHILCLQKIIYEYTMESVVNHMCEVDNQHPAPLHDIYMSIFRSF
jgi:hypothetical protein